jgi:hypothetical protein
MDIDIFIEVGQDIGINRIHIDRFDFKKILQNNKRMDVFLNFVSDCIRNLKCFIVDYKLNRANKSN